MEIAPIGLAGANGLGSSSSAVGGASAFAAVLGSVGKAASTPGHVGQAGQATSTPAPPASGQFPALGVGFAITSENGADMRLLANTVEVEAAPEPIEDGAQLPQPMPAGEEGPVFQQDTSASLPLPDAPAAELPVSGDEPKPAEKPAGDETTAIIPPEVDGEPAAPAVALHSGVDAIEIASEDSGTAVPRPEQPAADGDEPGAEAPAAFSREPGGALLAQVAARSQPAQAQVFNTEAKVARPGAGQSGPASTVEPDGDSALGSSSKADAAVERFAPAARKAGFERGMMQPETAAPAPLPAGQSSGQQNAAPLPPPPAGATIVAASGLVGPVPEAPVTRAENPSPVMAFRPDTVGRDIGLEIAKRVSAGGEELVIRLNPAELGRINIRMSMNEHGQLRAIVAADAASVVDAIRNDVPELSRALEQAGIRTDGQSFRFDRGGNGDPGGAWQQRYQQQNPENRHGERGSHAMTDEEPVYRRMGANGRINMMA